MAADTYGYHFYNKKGEIAFPKSKNKERG